MKVLLLLVLLTVLPTDMFAQTATKDAQATALISKSVSASGGSSLLSGIRDFTSQGTVTFYWDQPTQASAVLKGRANQFRFDATLTTGTRSWAVSNGSGVLLDETGNRTSFSQQTVHSLQNLSLPILDFISALQDPYAAISYVGLSATAQGQNYQVHIQESYPTSVDPSGTVYAAAARDYFIDPATFMVVGVSDNQSVPGSLQTYPHTLLFSTFTNVSGVMVPFSISESLNGQRTWSLQLSSTSFNVGLIDSDFQL